MAKFFCILNFRQVNVKPCDRPQDLYGEVANLVEKKRATDASGGDKLAKQLEGTLLITSCFIVMTASQTLFAVNSSTSCST